MAQLDTPSGGSTDTEKVVVLVDDSIKRLSLNQRLEDVGYKLTFSKNFTRPLSNNWEDLGLATSCENGCGDAAEFSLTFIGTTVELLGEITCEDPCSFLVSLDGGPPQNTRIRSVGLLFFRSGDIPPNQLLDDNASLSSRSTDVIRNIDIGDSHEDDPSIKIQTRSERLDVSSMNHTLRFSNFSGVNYMLVDFALVGLPSPTSQADVDILQPMFQLPDVVGSSAGPIAFMNYSDTRQNNLGFAYEGSWRESVEGDYLFERSVYIPSGDQASFEVAFIGTSFQLFAGTPDGYNSSKISITLDSLQIDSSPYIDLKKPLSWWNWGDDAVLSGYAIFYEARNLSQHNESDFHRVKVTIHSMNGSHPFLLGGMLYDPIISSSESKVTDSGPGENGPSGNSGASGTSNTLRGSAIAGIVVGALACLALVSLCAFCWLRRDRIRRSAVVGDDALDREDGGSRRRLGGHPEANAIPIPYEKARITSCRLNDATARESYSISDRRDIPSNQNQAELSSTQASSAIDNSEAGESPPRNMDTRAIEGLTRAMLTSIQAQIQGLSVHREQDTRSVDGLGGDTYSNRAPPPSYTAA